MPLTAEKLAWRVPTALEWELAISKLDWTRAISHMAVPPVMRQRDDRATPETISPERLQLASAGIKYLSAIIRQLDELRNEDDDDEYGVLRATQHAFHHARHLLIDAAIISARNSRQSPYGCASTDSEGGVRIEWVRPAARVHLVIPATDSRKPYIYHQVASDFATDLPATAEALAHWLSKIN